MKKKILTAITAAAIAVSSFTAVLAEDDITVLLNDQPIEFDVPPQIIESRTVVPFRAIFEALGYEVYWNQDAQTVTGVKGDITLTMVIGSTEATIKTKETQVNIGSGEADTFLENVVTFDGPPQIVDGRTLVPVRAVGEMSNYKVDWDEAARKVLITSPADIITEPGPAVSDDNNLPASGHGPAMPTQSPNPTTQTEPGPAVSEFPITYDDTNERESHSVRGFELTSVEKNEEGKYDITFTLKTFFEGRGTVAAVFDCLDENGKVVDTITGSYIGSDYAWTPHEDKATISGNTVKIVFHLDN